VGASGAAGAAGAGAAGGPGGEVERRRPGATQGEALAGAQVLPVDALVVEDELGQGDALGHGVDHPVGRDAGGRVELALVFAVREPGQRGDDLDDQQHAGGQDRSEVGAVGAD
jgi:hypothetical protein